MRRFELRGDGSNKFWEISRTAASITVHYGRIGTNGQTQTKDHADEKKAIAEHDKLVREKTAKGYAEIVVAAAAVGSAKATIAEPTVPAPIAKKKTNAKSDAVAEAPGSAGWIDAENGYRIAIRDGKLVCANAKGQTLSSVPKEVRDGARAGRLLDARDFLTSHARSCLEQTETWMLRSLPVPRSVLEAVWVDTGWRAALENAVVAKVGDDDEIDHESCGFFKGVDAARGLGIVTVDGETVWLSAARVLVLHPIRIEALDDLRALSTELRLTQGLTQLFRETFPKPSTLDKTATAIRDYREGKFAQLQHAARSGEETRISGERRRFDLPGLARRTRLRSPFLAG